MRKIHASKQTAEAQIVNTEHTMSWNWGQIGDLNSYNTYKKTFL